VTLPRRLAAGAVDGVLMLGLFAGLVLASTAVPALEIAFRLLAITFPPLLYFVIAEAYYQTTLGKRLFGLMVVTVDGERPEILAHVVRGMTRVPEAMMLMVPYLVVIPFSKRKQRFGDVITETLVVRRSDLEGR
jgi:uncharacterized RDD family membrane protein YckC